jgi:hypothetical protein
MANPRLDKTVVAHTAGLRHTCAHIVACVIFRHMVSAPDPAGRKILEVGPGKPGFRADRRRRSGNRTRLELAIYQAEQNELKIRIGPRTIRWNSTLV